MNSVESKIKRIRELLHFKEPRAFVVVIKDWNSGKTVGYLDKNARFREYSVAEDITQAKVFHGKPQAELWSVLISYPQTFSTKVLEIDLKEVIPYPI